MDPLAIVMDMDLNLITPRSLLRLMLELGELTLGVIVNAAGLAVRLACGRCRLTLEVGGLGRPMLESGK